MLAKFGIQKCVLVLAILVFTFGTRDARSADEIKVYNDLGELEQERDANELATALNGMASNYRMTLEPGVEYPIDDFTLTNKIDIEIDGGVTTRITDVTATGDRFYCEANHGIVYNSPVRLFGNVPSYNGSIEEGVTYYARNVAPLSFQLATGSGSSDPLLDVDGATGKTAVERLVFAQSHAIIVPASSTTSYDFLIKLVGCNDFHITDITFDGKYDTNASGYENGFKTTSGGQGKLLVADNCSGTLQLKCVHVANNRGKTSSAIDTHLAWGIYIEDCLGTVGLDQCTGSSTGYNTWRTRRIGDGDIRLLPR